MYSLLITAEEERIEIQRFYCYKAFWKQKEWLGPKKTRWLKSSNISNSSPSAGLEMTLYPVILLLSTFLTLTI